MHSHVKQKNPYVFHTALYFTCLCCFWNWFWLLLQNPIVTGHGFMLVYEYLCIKKPLKNCKPFFILHTSLLFFKVFTVIKLLYFFFFWSSSCIYIKVKTTVWCSYSVAACYKFRDPSLIYTQKLSSSALSCPCSL